MNPPIDRLAVRARWLIAVFLVALAWRGVALWQISQATFFEFLIGDAAAYDAWARDLAGGDWVGRRTFYQAPLYTYALGVVYATLGDTRLVVALVQSVLGGISAVLLCDAGWRLFSKGSGIVAGLLLGMYAPAVFSDLLIQKSSLDLLLVCWLTWLLSRIATGPRQWQFFALGVAGGLLTLNRENALAIAIVLGAWIVVSALRGTEVDPPVGHRRTFRPAALYLAGIALVLGPVAVRNRAVSGEWHLTTSQFGPNFYIGNHPGATGTYVPLASGRGDARFERQDAVALAETAEGRPLTDAEVSSYWAGRAWQFITSEPAAWSRLMLRKLVLFWNHAELTDTEDVATYAERSIALRVPGPWLNFGVLAVCAAAGLWCVWGRTSLVPLLLALILAYSLSVVAFYVVARYRLPIVPWLVLLSAAGVAQGWAWLREATWPRRAACLGGMLATGIVCGLPLVDPDRQRTTTHLNFGAELTDRGRWSEALEELQIVLAINPRFPEAHFNLGTVYVALGRLNEAAECFRTALELDPKFALASLNLGNVALDQGDTSAATDWFEHTLQLDPREYRAFNGLGLAAAANGDWETARNHFERAVTLAPDFAPAAESLERARSMLR